MLITPTVEQLRTMRLNGMADALIDQMQNSSIDSLSFEERLSFLLDRESNLRDNRLLKSRLKQAKLHCAQACIENMDYRPDRQIDKKYITRLATGDWIRQHKNLILTGATGTGKSWLACALAHKACLLGFKVQYWRIPLMLEELALARADGRYLKILKSFSKMDLIILDDWGMEKLTGTAQQSILQVLDDRYLKKSLILTSQLPIETWHGQIEDKTHADAILDRITGQAYRLDLRGPSMRQIKLTEGGEESNN